MSATSSGSTVTTISKVDDGQRSENGERDKSAGETVYAEATEGQPLVVRCAVRGSRPQANVTWYYYYKDRADDDVEKDDGGVKNDLNARPSKHGAPVVLGNSRQNSGGSTARSPGDYLISEQRRVEDGAEIMGLVEIAQHTEYQVWERRYGSTEKKIRDHRNTSVDHQACVDCCSKPPRTTS